MLIKEVSSVIRETRMLSVDAENSLFMVVGRRSLVPPKEIQINGELT